MFHGTDGKTRDKRDEPFKYRETGITIRSMWPIVTLLTLYVAAAGNLGLEQAGRANRSVLDAIVFYADPPSEVAQFPRDVREDLERYRQRLRAYRPRPRPPQLGSEMTMVYAAREGYERKLVAASTRSGVEQLAQEYVDTLRPCYEWEGFHECPEREAIFAERYLIDIRTRRLPGSCACSLPIDGSARPRRTRTRGSLEAPRTPGTSIKGRWP